MLPIQAIACGKSWKSTSNTMRASLIISGALMLPP
jgi:hypothetical protein